MTHGKLDRHSGQLAAAGIEIEEAGRQLELLRTPPAMAELERCCTVGDGILVLGESDRGELDSAWSEAAAAGRFAKFVPASGAASRMFAQLEAVRAAPVPRRRLTARAAEEGGAAAAVDELLARLEELPFFEELAGCEPLRGRDAVQLAGSDDYPEVLAAILDPAGLGYSERPKALIPFHRYPEGSYSGGSYPGGSRTALEEQLAEAADYVRGRASSSRLHFTVAADQRPDFEDAIAASPFAAGFEVSFSTQRPSTDTLAIEADGSPVRNAEGDLLLRPGGHGALLPNLEAFGGDLVYVKNIDNVVPEPHRHDVVVWQRLLGGLLASLEGRARHLRRSLLDGDDAAIEGAARFCRRKLNRSLPERDPQRLRPVLLEALHRPLRVCGMVPNAGEPGGGPFWVRDASGRAYPQIVEAAQVDLEDSGQREIWESSTHFNPVMLATALQRHDGTPHRLADYVDRQAVFVSRKPFEDRTIRVLEHPGLWNGAMAGWNTVFVEVPLSTFAPVKTVLDLLRPAHQGA